jgi:zinc transport system ATP-binding protein
MARTLAGRPELLVLDEPNAGVDLASQRDIAATLADQVAAGATLVVVLHELGPFEPLIQRSVLMRDGRIAYDGPPEGLDSVHDRVHDHAHHHPTWTSVPTPGAQAPLDGA